MRRRDSAARTFAPEIEPFFHVDPISLLVIDEPALPPQQNVDAPHPIAHTRLGNLPDARSFRSVIARVRLVVVRGTVQSHHARGMPRTHPIGIDQILRQLTFMRWLQSFFRTTS